MLFPSHQEHSSLSVCCSSHQGVIFKGMSVISGVCWREMNTHRGGGWSDLATWTRVACSQKAHGLFGDRQGVGQGARAARMVRHKAWVPLCPTSRPPGPALGLRYLQACLRSFGAIEQTGGSMLQQGLSPRLKIPASGQALFWFCLESGQQHQLKTRGCFSLQGRCGGSMTQCKPAKNLV